MTHLSSSRLAFRLASLSLVTASLAASSVARADDAADVATARALGVEGVTLAEAGKCKEAVEKLAKAEKLHHAPTTATPLGECEIALGRLVVGTEYLQRVVREPLPPNAHPAFVSSQTRAKKALDKALPRLATLRLGLSHGVKTPVSITIDGESVSDAILGADRRVDPGSHVIVVAADGYRAATATVAFEEGESKAIDVDLHPDPTARAKQAEPTRGAVAESRSSSTVPALVAFGLGAVGLGVGIYGAVTVDQKAGSLAGACGADKVCPTSAGADLDAARTWATVSTLGFVTAGVGAAAGTALLLFGGSGSREALPPTASATALGVKMTPTVGLGSVGVRGSF